MQVLPSSGPGERRAEACARRLALPPLLLHNQGTAKLERDGG